MKEEKKNEKIFLISQSVGNQTILHYLNETKIETPITGWLQVAAWFDIDEPWDSLKPWVEGTKKLNYEKIKKLVPNCICLISDNDNYTKDYKKTGKDWNEKIGSEIVIESGAGHFIKKEEEYNLPYIKDIIYFFGVLVISSSRFACIIRSTVILQN